MIINTDSIYIKGHNHKVCEDYSIDGSVPTLNDSLGDVHYAIVCDGCSGSDGYVDVGARLIAHGLIKFLRNMGNSVHYYYREPTGFYENLQFHMQRVIYNSAENFGLSKLSFVATIQAIIVIKDKLFHFHYGDGSIIHYCDGDIHRPYYTDFPSGAPYYFVDSFEGRDMERYCKRFEMNKVIQDGVEFDVHDYVYEWSNFWNVIDLNTMADGNNVFAVTSDGIETCYYNDDNDNGKQVAVDFDDTLNAAFCFKNFQGEFVKRRFNKFFKVMEDSKIKHYDDISVAAISIKKEGDL